MCYGRIYDSIASRYHYTIDEFYELTTRQIMLLLKILGDAKYEEFKLQATLHGVKLKPRPEALVIKKEDKELYDKQARATLKKLRKRFYKNGK